MPLTGVSTNSTWRHRSIQLVSVLTFSVAVASPRPWVVGAVEVCNSWIAGLESDMSSMGYAIGAQNYVSVVASSTVCPPGSGRSNVVFLLGTSPTATTITPTQDPADNAGETRRAICNRTQTFLGPLAGCATHLTKNGGSYATLQASQVQVQVESQHPSMRKFVVGDFNLRPPPPPAGFSAVPATWYTDYWEDPTNGATRITGVKNDFAFGRKTYLNSTRSSTITPVASSDHYYFVMLFHS